MEFVELKEFGLRVSSRGHVYSTIMSVDLNHYPDRSGYPRVYCRLPNGKRRGLFLHRLMAIAFIPNPDGLPCVNHKDGNKGNFALENLEWCTHGENMRHAKNTGLWKREMGIEHLRPRDAVIMNLYRREVSREIICEAFGLKRPALNRIIRENK